MPTLDEAIESIRAGRKTEARGMLEELLDIDENDEEVWLWLSSVVDSEDDCEICLENVLALDPQNSIALRGLEALRSGAFDADDLLSELLQEEDELVDSPTTFIDDFVLVEEGERGEKQRLANKGKADKKKGGGLNFRVILIAVLVLLLIGVMTAVGVAAAFLLGDNSDAAPTPAQGTPAQQAPGLQDEPEPTPTATDTPTPAPTDTPTLTPTSALQLPTQRPTELPTPTATRVVSPTPIK